VLRQACTDAATWQSNLKVSVNLSPLQFRDSNLVPLVQQTLAAAGLPAWRLELEITEGVLLHDNETTLTTLHKLRALGICISMDDFGTGYSSLSYLRSFPFDKIKIDQSFIRDLAEQPDSVAIVRAVTGLGSSLGIHTTAEGVETEDQLARLVAEGCTEVQGYLFSPPCPAKEVGRMVAEISRRPAVGLIQIKPEALAC
jgi:EAL domain-containing protein (putative c-di-GMP-specific phosphodiesterase class I)